MNEPRPYYRIVGWWLVAYAAAIAPIDFDTFGLASGGSIDNLKWIIRLPVYFVPLLVIAPRWGQLFEAFRRPPTSWLLLWAMINAVSVAWAIVPSQAILLGFGIASFVVLATWLVFTEGWPTFASAMLTGVTVTVGAGLLYDVANETLLPDRAIGLAYGPADVSGLAAVGFVLSAALIWRDRWTPLGWATAAIHFSALVFAETRTTAVAILIGVLYGTLRRLPTMHRVAIILALGALLFVVLGLGLGFDALLRDYEQDDPTQVAGRSTIWPIAIELILEDPLLGYGVGSPQPLFIEAARQGRITFLAGTTHMIPLAAAMNTGFIGLSFLASALFSAFRRRRSVDAWVLAPLLSLLVMGSTESIVDQPTLGVLMIAGILAAMARPPDELDEATTGRGRGRTQVAIGKERPRSLQDEEAQTAERAASIDNRRRIETGTGASGRPD